VEHKTPRICLLAVRQDGLALAHVQKQTEQIIAAAVAQNEAARRYIKRT
jgi:hypothetical protein